MLGAIAVIVWALLLLSCCHYTSNIGDVTQAFCMGVDSIIFLASLCLLHRQYLVGIVVLPLLGRPFSPSLVAQALLRGHCCAGIVAQVLLRRHHCIGVVAITGVANIAVQGAIPVQSIIVPALPCDCYHHAGVFARALLH
jgi:hypothetical protein